MRIPITADVDAATLAAAFTKALGRPVSVSSRNPGQKDDTGKDLPGIVILLDGATGEELGTQDQQTVAAVMANHKVPTPPPSPAQTLLDALAGAGNNVGAVIAALKAYAGAAVAAENKHSPTKRPDAKP